MNKYKQKAAEKTLAAYETSTDYDRLHELAKQGYKIPCFLWSNLVHDCDTLFFRCVNVHRTGYGCVEISECGRVFIDDMPGLEHFKKQCEIMEVRFIMPNVKEVEK